MYERNLNHRFVNCVNLVFSCLVFFFCSSFFFFFFFGLLIRIDQAYTPNLDSSLAWRQKSRGKVRFLAVIDGSNISFALIIVSEFSTRFAGDYSKVTRYGITAKTSFSQTRTLCGDSSNVADIPGERSRVTGRNRSLLFLSHNMKAISIVVLNRFAGQDLNQV